MHIHVVRTEEGDMAGECMVSDLEFIKIFKDMANVGHLNAE